MVWCILVYFFFYKYLNFGYDSTIKHIHLTSAAPFESQQSVKEAHSENWNKVNS